jgi:hypothetical protein
VNRGAVLASATCLLFFRGVDRLLPTDGVGGADDTPGVVDGAAAEGVGVVARLAFSRAPWRGRGARASGVAETVRPRRSNPSSRSSLPTRIVMTSMPTGDASITVLGFVTVSLPQGHNHQAEGGIKNWSARSQL